MTEFRLPLKYLNKPLDQRRCLRFLQEQGKGISVGEEGFAARIKGLPLDLFISSAKGGQESILGRFCIEGLRCKNV